MDNQNRLNYFHTNVVIPNIILSNKDVFIEKIVKTPKNLEYFIKEDTYKTAATKLGLLNYNPISCHLSANEFNGYFVVFVEFPQEYVTAETANIGIAFAIKGDKLRYFTYEYGISIIDNQPEYFVGEWSIVGNEVTNHLNYGTTNGYGMPKFASKIKELLESEVE